MQFDSLPAALAMGGHGPFVWSVVLVSVLVMAGLLLLPWWRARRWRRQALQRRDQAHQKGAS